MIRRRVSSQQLDADPSVLWNEFIDILAMSQPSDLTDAQKAAQFAFWYESEVQNGGHLQYFENQGTQSAPEVIASLGKLGAARQAEVFSRALARQQSKARTRIQTVGAFVDASLDGEFADLDEAYAACTPEMTDLLKRYLDQHERDFIERI